MTYLSWTDSFVHIHQAFSQFECLIIPSLLLMIELVLITESIEIITIFNLNVTCFRNCV